MAPKMTKSEPSLFARISCLVTGDADVGVTGREHLGDRGCVGTAVNERGGDALDAKSPLASARYHADHSMSGTQLNGVRTVPRSGWSRRWIRRACPGRRGGTATRRVAPESDRRRHRTRQSGRADEHGAPHEPDRPGQERAGELACRGLLGVEW